MKCLVIILLACLTIGEGVKRCGNRQQEAFRTRIRADIACMAPKRQVVQVPIPEEYDYVSPQVTLLHLCTGYQCSSPSHQCFAVSNITKILAVTAYKRNDIFNGICIDIPVQEHGACGCKCMTKESDCSKTQEFNKHICKCLCQPGLKEVCLKRNEVTKMHMWNKEKCACMCNVITGCSSGTYWNPDVCRCVTMNHINEVK